MIPDILHKYFNSECSETEKQSIRDYFANNPGVLSDYLEEEEWEAFLKDGRGISPNTPAEVPAGKVQSIFATVARRRIRKFISAAAVLLLVAAAGLFYFLPVPQNRLPPLADLGTEQTVHPGTYISKTNNGNRLVTVKLPDGTIVSLSPNSEIKYKENFDGDKRDLMLEGEAVFEVAKDSSRPFTVYSGEIATTALGTRFRVSTLKDKNRIIVELYEGKVVVKPTVATNNKKDDFVLHPGNAIAFDRLENAIGFVNMHLAEPLTLKQTEPDVAKSKKRFSSPLKTDDIQFENQPISEVFNYLSEKHHVKIIDSTGRLSAIGFVGRIKENEPVEAVLTNISSMNGYKVNADSANRVFVIR